MVGRSESGSRRGPLPDRRGRGSAKERRKRILRSRYADFLPEAQAVAESEPTPLATTLIVAVALVFAAGVAWAGFAEVDQVATAPGVVRPAGKVKVVNHPDGGRVAAILVKEGDRVEAGDTLVELDPELNREEIAKRTSEWQSLSAEASRLEAEAGGTAPVFDPEIAAARPDLAGTQFLLFEARRQSLEANRAVADRVIEQRDRDVKALQARHRQYRRSLVILKEQESAVATLAEKGYFPRLRFLSIRRQVSELEGQVEETLETAHSAQSALAEARSRRTSIDEEWRSEVLARLADTRRKRDQAKNSLTQERSRLRNLSVLAPIAGIVQNIAVTASGQSIRANEPLLNVVPTGAQLVIEARVANDDIGHVTVGQAATVRVRTYDFVRFGTLEGVVERIAADAVEDQETGQLIFNVMVRTDRAYLGRNTGDQPVNPGMQAEVDLHIGKRSILSYLTDRLSRTARSAFRER